MGVVFLIAPAGFIGAAIIGVIVALKVFRRPPSGSWWSTWGEVLLVWLDAAVWPTSADEQWSDWWLAPGKTATQR